ncbi:hypothetical protein BDV12DRAFT_202257 [Aspergillus spectabilis]
MFHFGGLPSSAERPTFSIEKPIFSAEKPLFGAKNSLATSLGALSLGVKHKIIVGVDYGTTFTGASYVSSMETNIKDIKDIVVIDSWPGPSRNTDTVSKTPSRIAYAADNERLSKDRWGFQVEPGMVSYSWTKLLLDRGTPLTQYDDSALEEASKIGIMRLPEGKTAADVVGDYLSEVYQHILKTIGKSITEESLQITPLEFWFTVPAIWSDRAQDATRNAARHAGFAGTMFRPWDRVFLISEPEAAAIAVLKKYSSSTLGGSVKAGDGVLVCDCGGGTVDITTYLVNETTPLKFEELCAGMGGKCGSTAVDRNFYKLMSERFGEAFDKLPAKRKSPGSDFMKRFELLKRDFGASDEQASFELPLNMTVDDPDPKYFDEDERLVIVSSDDLRKLFDPVVDQIIQLVKRQIDDANTEAGRDIIKRIILVGGFGDSEYLRKAFKSSFGSDGKIAITVPEIPQAAIVQGAALRGLEGIRSSTKRCRRHYGFAIDTEFRPGVDDGANTYWDTYNGRKMVRGIMKWAIQKGQKYAEDHTERFPLQWKKHPTSDSSPRLPLYACEQTVGPERHDHKDVYKIGDIAVELSDVDLSRFDSKLINGVRVYDIWFQLKVTFGAQEGLLKFEAISLGRTIGQTSIDFSTAKYY